MALATGPEAVTGAQVSTETIDVPVLKALLSTIGLQGNGYLQVESPLAQSTPPERIDLFLEGPLFSGDRLQVGVVAADSTDLATRLQTTEVS